MKFNCFGNPCGPVFIMLHGGGLSHKFLEEVAEPFFKEFKVVLPDIDGHGESSSPDFESIELSARNLLEYIKTECDNSVFALAGLSLGAQIVIEALCEKPDIAKYAVIESGLVLPVAGTRLLTAPSCSLCYPLIAKRWFSRLQAKSLFVPERLFEDYYRDSMKISRRSLVNITLSNGTYTLKPGITSTAAKALIICGEKEISLIKRSAQLLSEKIPDSELYIAKGMKHGELSLNNPKRYAELVSDFFKA